MPTNKALQFARFFLRVSGWIALIPLGIGILLSISALRLQLDLATLNRDGVEVSARVTEKHVLEGANGYRNSQKSGPAYYVTIEFNTLDQRPPQVQEHNIARSFYDAHASGDSFALRYLPQNPLIVELYPGQLSSDSLGSQVVGAVVSMLGFLLVFFYGRTAVKAMRARASVTKELEAYVTLRHKWPPLLNRMHFQTGTGASATFHKTFLRFTPAYRSLKRPNKIRAVETEHGIFWAEDLFL